LYSAVRIAGRGDLFVFTAVTDRYSTNERQTRQIKSKTDNTLGNFVELKLAKVVAPRRFEKLTVYRQLQTDAA
jgi:hypothetical protein